MQKIIIVAVAIFIAVVCAKETETAITPAELEAISAKFADVRRFRDFLEKLEIAKNASLKSDKKAKELAADANNSLSVASDQECKCDVVCYVKKEIYDRIQQFMPYLSNKDNAETVATIAKEYVYYYFFAVHVNSVPKTCKAYKSITEAQRKELTSKVKIVESLFNIMNEGSFDTLIYYRLNQKTEFAQWLKYLNGHVEKYCKSTVIECKALSGKRSELCTFLEKEKSKLTESAKVAVFYGTIEGIAKKIQPYLIELYDKVFKDKSCDK